MYENSTETINLTSEDSSIMTLKKEKSVARGLYGEKDVNILQVIGRGGFSKVHKAELKAEETVEGPIKSSFVAVKKMSLYNPACGYKCMPFIMAAPAASRLISKRATRRTVSTHMLKNTFGQGRMRPSEALQEARLLELLIEDPFFLKFYGSFFSNRGKTFNVITELCVCSLRRLQMQSRLLYKEGRINRFPPSVAFHFTLPVLEALAHMHQKGIIHRDIKEENILITRSGVPKVCDLGLSVTFDRSKHPIAINAEKLVGTNWYMAPEIVRGDKYNQSVDSWSCAMMLLSMLRGGYPFESDEDDVITLWEPQIVNFYKYDYFVMETRADASGQEHFYEMARVDSYAIENKGSLSASFDSRKSKGDKLMKMMKSFLRQLLVVNHDARPSPGFLLKMEQNARLTEYLQLWHEYLDTGVLREGLERSSDKLGKFRTQFNKVTKFVQKLVTERLEHQEGIFEH